MRSPLLRQPRVQVDTCWSLCYERAERGLDELVADCGLGERGGALLVAVALEGLHELADFSRDRHRRLTVRWLT